MASNTQQVIISNSPTKERNLVSSDMIMTIDFHTGIEKPFMSVMEHQIRKRWIFTNLELFKLFFERAMIFYDDEREGLELIYKQSNSFGEFEEIIQRVYDYWEGDTNKKLEDFNNITLEYIAAILGNDVPRV